VLFTTDTTATLTNGRFPGEYGSASSLGFLLPLGPEENVGENVGGFMAQGFYGLDVLTLTQSTASKHWRKHKVPTLTSGLGSSSVIHYQTPPDFSDANTFIDNEKENKVLGIANKITRISCHWQTHATRCITANVLQTNKVDAQCDKLATELSWQCFASKVTNFQLPHLYLTYLTCIWHLCWGWPCLSFAEIFGIRKLDTLGYRVALFV